MLPASLPATKCPESLVFQFSSLQYEKQQELERRKRGFSSTLGLPPGCWPWKNVGWSQVSSRLALLLLKAANTTDAGEGERNLRSEGCRIDTVTVMLQCSDCGLAPTAFQIWSIFQIVSVPAECVGVRCHRMLAFLHCMARCKGPVNVIVENARVWKWWAIACNSLHHLVCSHQPKWIWSPLSQAVRDRIEAVVEEKAGAT